MILLDVNLLLYAYNSTFKQHSGARAWLERALSEPAPVGLPWTTILAFLRVSTNPHAFPHPLEPDEAITIVSASLLHPVVVIVEPGERHWEIWSSLLRSTQSRGPRVTDGQLAALAIEHGATLCTTGHDFKVFPGLRLQNPLETESRE